jgi:hypothetical protein
MPFRPSPRLLCAVAYVAAVSGLVQIWLAILSDSMLWVPTLGVLGPLAVLAVASFAVGRAAGAVVWWAILAAVLLWAAVIVADAWPLTAARLHHDDATGEAGPAAFALGLGTMFLSVSVVVASVAAGLGVLLRRRAAYWS